MKEIAEKIAAVTGQLGTFAASFDAVNTQITAVTGQIDAVTGQFGTVTQQINDATAAIDGVSKQFDDVSKQISTAAESISGVTQQFSDVSGKLTGAKDAFTSVSDTLEKAKTSFADVTKTVSDTKTGIDGIKTSADEAEKLTSGTAAAGGADAAALTSVGEAITAATGAITAELALPEFKAAFDKAKLEELKKKLKIETTYEGGEDEFEDGDILSTIEIDDIPAMPEPAEDDLMADLPQLDPEPVAEPELVLEPEPVPAKPEPKAEKKAPKKIDDDLSEFMITPTTDDDDMSAGVPLINTKGVGAIDDFTLDAEPEPIGDDFDLAPNDLTATPDKGMDLGEDIFDMAINPVDTDDDTLGRMMAEKKVADEMGDFELTPAEIKDEYKPSAPAFTGNDDFGEFADLFAAGSAETTAPVEKKKPAAFRQTNNSDDPFNFGSDDNDDDDDMSSDSDLSDLLL